MDEPTEERMEEAYDEAELSDDEFGQLSSNDLFDRLESNDPSLTNLKVRLLTLVQNNDDHRWRLDKLATAISRNTQLKALMLEACRVRHGGGQTINFLRGIACNQSIKRLHFSRCGDYLEYLGHACRILTPLFKRNQVERIRIHNCKLSHERIGLLATSLAMFDSLKEFALTDSTIQDDPDSQQAARDLVQSLSGHSRLRKIDLSSTNVGKLGCSELADLLSNQDINLRVLNLASNNLGGAEAAALSFGMAGNISLKEINLTLNSGITEVGWQVLFCALSRSRCRLERLSLRHNEINDATAQCLSNALTSNMTLKMLDLAATHGITITGWRVLFEFLRSPICELENLDLRCNQLNDEVMAFLTEALASNMSLKSLNLNGSEEVTGAAWQRFFSTVLANLSSGLEKLDLGYCDINNAAIRSLTDALVDNSKLKVLTLNGINLFSDTGWETFSSILESPYTALEKLDLGDNDLDDATLTSLMNSLANNKKLKKLCFDYSDGWEPPTSVLCNTESIMSTYNSNHTLEKVGGEYEMPEEFESLLQINRENSPGQAAQLKIIKTHFNKGFITQPFVGMNLNVLPHAMAWMGRDSRVGKVDGHYFSFIQSISSLFENVN